MKTDTERGIGTGDDSSLDADVSLSYLGNRGADHPSAKHDHFVATPLIRFFYKTYLFEVGYSSN